LTEQAGNKRAIYLTVVTKLDKVVTSSTEPIAKHLFTNLTGICVAKKIIFAGNLTSQML